MSLGTGNFEDNQNPQVKPKTVEIINRLGKGFSKANKSGPLNSIASFCFITTAIGELFGVNYGIIWYMVLFTLLIMIFIKDFYKPKEE